MFNPPAFTVTATRPKEDLLPLVQMLADPTLDCTQKVSVMQHIATHTDDIFLPPSAKLMEEFEHLIDSLLYHLLAYSEQFEQEQGKLSSSLQKLQLVSHAAFDLLTCLVGLSQFEHNPNSAPNMAKQAVNT